MRFSLLQRQFIGAYFVSFDDPSATKRGGRMEHQRRFMNFFRRTNIFEMFMACLRMDGSGNGLQCFNRRPWAHKRYKGIFRETLSIATAAIFVKKVTIFWGDPSV